MIACGVFGIASWSDSGAPAGVAWDNTNMAPVASSFT